MHSAAYCKTLEKPVCGKCAGSHKTNECVRNSDEFQCVNCQENHASFSRACLIYQEKVNTGNYAKTNKVSYADATKLIRQANL